MTTKLERLERIEAEAAALRKEIENESKPKTVCFTPKEDEWYWQLGGGAGDRHLRACGHEICPPKAAFRDQETCDAYAEAFNVMLELRLYADGGKFVIYVDDGKVYTYEAWTTLHSYAYFSGRYSSEAQAQLAFESVGKERIIAAVKTLCGDV